MIYVNGQKIDSSIQVSVGKSAYDYARDGGYSGTEAQYSRDMNPDNINANSINFLSEELAKRGQLSPEFVNTLEECTDTSKLYVLPDNFIYAYIAVPVYENLARPEPDNETDTTKWVNGYRIASGGVSAQSGKTLTNVIEDLAIGDVIRIKGVDLDTNDRFDLMGTNPSASAVQNIRAKYAETEAAGVTTYENIDGVHTFTVLYKYFTLNDISLRFTIPTPKKPYDIIITKNQEITDGKAYRWTNTGHAFVPADYEDRILDTEERLADHESRLITLERNQGVDEDALPNYWEEAVDGLEATMKTRQAAGADAFQFLWFSDLHGVDGSTSNAGRSVVKHIGKVAQYTADKYNIPLVAISGDLHHQSTYASEDSVWAQFAAVRELLSPIDKTKLIYTKGNHDGAWGDNTIGEGYRRNIGSNQVYNALFRGQANDRGRVFGGNGTYFYVDTPQKVRFFMLNSHTDGDGSVDENGLAVYNSQKYPVFGSEQLAWLADALLAMPEGWGAVLMAHVAFKTGFNWEDNIVAALDGNLLGGLLQAYKNKTSFTGSVDFSKPYWGNGVEDATYKQTSVSADFTNAKGEIIAYFHGHWHQDYNHTANDITCLAITTAGADVRDTEPQIRTENTATETALDIVTIDRRAKKIYCTRLGAGEDREFTY